MDIHDYFTEWRGVEPHRTPLGDRLIYPQLREGLTDLLLDRDSGALYLGEMHPRLTGATPMTTQVMLDAGSVPLVLFHLLEWFDCDYQIDVESFNRQWLESAGLSGCLQMIIEQCADAGEVITRAPRSGLWRMAADGTIEFVGSAFDPRAVASASEALLVRTIDPDRSPARGECLGRLVLRGRLMSDDYRLTERARMWVHGFRGFWQSRCLPLDCGRTAMPPSSVDLALHR